MTFIVKEKTKTISPVDFNAETGTWTLTDASNVITLNKTTAASTSIVRIPFNLDRNEEGAGIKITKVEFLYNVGTAALDADATIALVRVPIEAAPTALAITQTDNFSQTATSGLVKCTVNVTYPAFDRIEANNSATYKTTVPVDYFLELTVATDADNTFKIGSATVYYHIED